MYKSFHLINSLLTLQWRKTSVRFQEQAKKINADVTPVARPHSKMMKCFFVVGAVNFRSGIDLVKCFSTLSIFHALVLLDIARDNGILQYFFLFLANESVGILHRGS